MTRSCSTTRQAKPVLQREPDAKGDDKKAKKTDIAAVEYLLADLDPADGETPEAAKARYLSQLKTSSPSPPRSSTSATASRVCGNEKRMSSEPVKENLTEDQAKIADVEARTAAVMVRLGSQGRHAERRPHTAAARHHQPAEQEEARGRPRAMCHPTDQLQRRGLSAEGVPAEGRTRQEVSQDQQGVGIAGRHRRPGRVRADQEI